MDLFAEVKALVLDGLARLAAEGRLPQGLDLGAVTVEPPRDPAHGDMATNAAMVLARPARMAPRDIAAALAETLAGAPGIVSAEVAGPGFLNLRLAPGRWFGFIPAALAAGTGFGRSELGAGRRVNVEFVSANPTGPMHVGHVRGAVFGDALAGLLAFAGHEVTREYYINDGGAQVDVLARSAYERYREACGLEPAIAEGLYPGDYLIPVGAALKEKYGERLLERPEAEWLAEVRDFATEAMMAMIREDLALLHVRMDTFFSEKSLYGTGRIEAALASLEAEGPALRGHARGAEGQAARGLGAARADAVPLDRLRRRHRPPGDEVGRRLDLLRPRHRLSLRQDRARLRRADRRARRRSRRLRQADEGGGRRALRRRGAARRQALPARAAATRAASPSRCRSAPAPS